MLRPYRDVLRLPGAARFSAAGFLARSTMSMTALGIVLLTEQVFNSYGIAGLVVSAATLAGAVGAPLSSRLMDRHGQRAIAMPLVTVHALGMLALIVSIQRQLPVAVILGIAVLAGGTAPSVGALVRARWATLLRGDQRLRAAFSLESVIEEFIFVLGPPVATLLALHIRYDMPLILVAGLTFIGTLLLVNQRATEPPRRENTGERHPSALRTRGLPAAMIAFIMLGAVFASFEVTTVGFAEQLGRPSLTGVMVGTYAAGSLVAGVLFGAVNLPWSWRRQFATAMTSVAVFLLPMPVLTLVFTNPLAPFLALAFVAGFAVAPSLISGMALVEQLVPAHSVTEGLAWVTTGIGVGFAFASAASGALIDAVGADRTYGLVLGCALAGVVAVASGWRTWARATVPRAATGLDAAHT